MCRSGNTAVWFAVFCHLCSCANVLYF